MSESPPSPSPEDRSEFLELLARALDRMETEGSAGLERLCRDHPAHEALLRARVAELGRMGLVRAAGSESFPERLGEFRLLARIGEGGMGVVYLAEQTSLKRRVALKLVRPEQLYFAGARERFRREVESVARMQHPGIVPVYTFGEEGGVPYYAMEHVAGATLADVIGELSGGSPAKLGGREMLEAVRSIAARTGGGELSRATARGSGELPKLFSGTWVAAALGIARQVAEALQHAHERGVLHRDVKPSNVLLTPDGRALLFDFGLASAGGSVRLTRTGGQLGSVAYMSPEQARGEHAKVDARSDVYSLGVALYELLALRAPFAESSVEATRLAVLHGRPAPLREQNPAVPRDAETVCLTAMDPDPTRRYASAAAFAADLANVLELRPIEARRPGALVRARRFAQRNPASAVAIVLGSLLFIGGPLAFAIQQNLSRAAIAQSLEREKGERARAEKNLDRARQAVDLMLTQVAEERLQRLPGMEEVRRELLGAALDFYRQFLAERGSDPSLRIGTAEAAWRVSDLYRTFGRNEEALQAGGQAVELLEALRAEAPEDENVLDRLADTHSTIGITLAELGRVDEALVEAGLALEVRQERERLAPGGFEAARDLYDSHSEHGRLYAQLGRVEEELTAREEASQRADRLHDLARTSEEEEAAIRGAITAANNLGLFHLEQQRLEPAAEVFGRALEHARRVSDLERADPATVLSLLTMRINYARLLEAERSPSEAEQVYDEALPELEDLVLRFPAWVEARQHLATGWSNYGLLLQELAGRAVDAERALARAIENERALVDFAPDVPQYRANLGADLVNRGSVWREQGDHFQALADFEEAALLVRSAVADEPDHPAHAHFLYNALWFLALTHLDLGDHAAAIEAALGIPGTAREGPQGLRLAAGLVARASRVAERDETLGPEAKEAAARAAREQALDLLWQAVEAGLTDAPKLLATADVEALLAEPAFQELVERVRSNDEQREDSP